MGMRHCIHACRVQLWSTAVFISYRAGCRKSYSNRCIITTCKYVGCVCVMKNKNHTKYRSASYPLYHTRTYRKPCRRREFQPQRGDREKRPRANKKKCDRRRRRGARKVCLAAAVISIYLYNTRRRPSRMDAEKPSGPEREASSAVTTCQHVINSLQ